jgi:hypothetical protein
MNLLTIEGGLAVMTDDEVIENNHCIVKCGVCSDADADVYHYIDRLNLHASGRFLVGLMTKLHKVEVH